MKLHISRGIDYSTRHPPSTSLSRRTSSPAISYRRRSPAVLYVSRRRITLSLQNREIREDDEYISSGRRGIVLIPLLAAGASFLRPAVATLAEEKPLEVPVVAAAPPAEKVEEVASRIYDATVIGEPLAVGKDKIKVWEKVMNARIVYLGEAEQVPIRDDKELELEIVKSLAKRCLDSNRLISLAIEAFPCDTQDQLDRFMAGRISEETLRSYTPHWPPERWEEYSPLFSYCRDNGVRVVACGTPLEVLRTVQSEGIRGLSKADRGKYSPPAGSGFISGFNAISRRLTTEQPFLNDSFTFGPSSYLSVQARAVEDHTMSQVILQAVAEGGASGLLVVVTGATHVMYGPRGKGVPARISKKMQKKNQVVILLDPERQFIRREGEVPVADFLWYPAARACSRNCFDRAEIARIMNAAGTRRDALPQDLQKGLDLGLVSPEVLQNFFDLEQYPIISELTHRFQGFRERLLADPKFLHKLAIEEGISITTTLLAQYEKRKENFFQELDYVITDTLRGAVVDFFTVWLPAPTLSFLSFSDDMDMSDSVDSLKGLLGSIPDNAFQKNPVGKNWNLTHRVVSLLVGGLKLSGVGFVSSIGAVAASNTIFALRKLLNPALVIDQKYKRSPILKTAAVYSLFLGTSANLRYQVIAGLVEHRISEFLPAQILVNMLSFCSRTINSYWGTQQWIDLARYTGLQTRKAEASVEDSDPPDSSSVECSSSDDTNVNDIKNQ